VTQAALSADAVLALHRQFGKRFQENASLARYTAARVGGPADGLLIARSADDLAAMAGALWDLDVPFRVLGGGSNVLVADGGVRGAVVLNQAKGMRFLEDSAGAHVRAESGVSLGMLARRAAEAGHSGLEWAASVPGTVGGAVVGNAGAHGGDTAGCLEMADILQRGGARERWPVERLEYAYRDSFLKRNPGKAVVLAAGFRLEPSSPELVKARMAEHVAYRRTTQPPGASWGSMFKNPPGDHAGRLIEAAGLKGARQGEVEVSPQHANFFVNRGGAKASDVWALIQRIRAEVARQSGVTLELEIELLGDWEPAGAGERGG
jgi:UDP-N-acetylmuramate dehydrogenase